MWTAEQVQEIRAHVATGLSRAAIAQIYGVTRNAMVGLCYRHAISGPNNQVVGAMVAKQRKQRANLLRSTERPNLPEKTATDRWARKAKPTEFKFKFEPPANEPAPLRISIVDLTALHCHNPIGETDDDCAPLYCGHPTQDSSYCPFHHKLFHTTWQRRS